MLWAAVDDDLALPFCEGSSIMARRMLVILFIPFVLSFVLCSASNKTFSTRNRLASCRSQASPSAQPVKHFLHAEADRGR